MYWRPLVGVTPVDRAIRAARGAGCNVLVTTDHPESGEWIGADLVRQTPLHGDRTAMIDIIKDVLAVTSEDYILLVQPTQPLRRTEHLIEAICLLTTTDPRPDSVVSLVQVPVKYHPLWQLSTHLRGNQRIFRKCLGSGDFTTHRQLLEAEPTYIRDGTVYAFWRKTVEVYGNIYGKTGIPLIIPPNETCALDTPEDWAEAEARLLAV